MLREHIADESLDLIYLDPPFNSKRDYNLLFKTPKGQDSDASITAFKDTWHWETKKDSQASGGSMNSSTRRIPLWRR